MALVEAGKHKYIYISNTLGGINNDENSVSYSSKPICIKTLNFSS